MRVIGKESLNFSTRALASVVLPEPVGPAIATTRGPFGSDISEENDSNSYCLPV